MLDAYISSYNEDFNYAFDNEIILNWYSRRIIQKCNSYMSLLELGIGHGFTTTLFSSYFRRHVVLEGSEAMIRQYCEKNPDCSSEIIKSFFEEFNTEELFDCIVMGFVLEHVNTPIEILHRYKKFLAPGGRCFIAVPNAESLHRRIGREAGLISNIMKLGIGDLELGHQRLYSVDRLRTEIEECGYNLINMEGIFLKPFSTSQLESLHLSPQVLQALCSLGVDYPELSCALLAEIEV